MKQKQYSPLSIAEMAVSLFAAEHGFLDDIELEKIGSFEHALHSFVNSEKKDLMEKINSTGEYDEEIEKALHDSIEEFKKNHAW